MTRVNAQQAVTKIANREPFVNSSGTFRGVPGDEANSTTGMMPDGPEMDDYLAQKAWGFLDYIVFSYSTPIAWYSNRDGWHITEHRYTMTTKCKHMPYVRRAMDL